jgi:NTP pyrophosphatase (non-canonical NTP hydrolase)
MDMTDYQHEVARQTIKLPAVVRTDVILLGLADQMGQVAGHEKKRLLASHGVRLPDPKSMRERLGDALWHLAAVAELYKLDLSEIAAANIRKVDGL